jgi:receptor protein-tyrosine kinase
LDLRDLPRNSPPLIDDCTFGPETDGRLVVHIDANPVFVEQYRRLGAVLHQAQLKDGIASVMVASAVEAEGKTVTATNLALTLSRSFKKRVLLIDGDLRKPAVHELLKLEVGIGLSDVLKRPGGHLPVQTLSPTLSVITGGQQDSDPVALLTSDAVRQLFTAARERFDWIVVDTPPIALFPDAGLFVGMLDTCLLVVKSATTPARMTSMAVAALGASRILGVVLNRADPSEIAAGYGYNEYGYAADRGSDARFALWRTTKR